MLDVAQDDLWSFIDRNGRKPSAAIVIDVVVKVAVVCAANGCVLGFV